jgi:hypothetical protein
MLDILLIYPLLMYILLNIMESFPETSNSLRKAIIQYNLDFIINLKLFRKQDSIISDRPFYIYNRTLYIQE